MADTKISALTDVVTLAAGDKVPVADASDLTVSKSATMTEINTYLRTLPLSSAEITTLPAASALAAANTIPVDQSGTAGEATMTQVNTYLRTLPLSSAEITALPAASALAAADTFPVDQSATAGEATMTQLKTFMRPTVITGNSGTVDQSDVGAVTYQILTAANTDIPTTTLVNQLTAQTLGVGWWHVQYWIIWQSNVTTTGITFRLDHSGTAVNSQYTRQDRTSSTTALATVGIADQDAPTAAGTGWLPSNWAVRADATNLGPNAGVDTINVNQLTYIDGLLLVTGSGNLVLQAASEVASTITRVSQGTFAIYRRLS